MIPLSKHNKLVRGFVAILMVSGALALPQPTYARSVDGPGSAFIGKIVGTVEVRGLKRIEKDAILAKLVTKPGQPITREGVRADIKTVFAMGYFDDIEVQGEPQANGTVQLVIAVRERPVISKIEFQGNERIGTSDLQDVVKVKEWSILDFNKVKDDTALIQKHYEDKGFYLAKVRFEVKPVKPDEVELIYKINDYDKVQIKKITFLNNKSFSDEQLKAVFQATKEGGLFSFMSGSGSFRESAFKMDLQMLQLFYLDRGYVKFRYENPIVTVSDDKKFLFITIYVDEGDQYRMGSIGFGGDLLYSKEELHENLLLTEGDVFSITKRNQDIQKLTEKYKDRGYAFTNVIPKMNVHDETKTVDHEYTFEKGHLVYFGEINILGNSKTYDKVIRRELKIHEGELYNGTRMRESRENVERLGYFAPGEVVFNEISPKGRPDVLNVEITVKERSTGTVTLGAGYGTNNGIFFTAQVAEINLLGRGQTISLTTQLSGNRESKNFNLGFTEPYTFDTQWSSGFDLYYTTFPIPERYTPRRLGFDVRLGHPIAEYTNAYITYKNEGLRVENVDYRVDPEEVALDQGVLSSLVWQVVRDKRNNRFETTDGNYQSAQLETAGLGGDKRFLKWNLNARYYRRLIGDLVFRTSWEYGQMARIGDNPLPPSEKYYLGGPNNMKGFQPASLGPQKVRVVTNPADGKQEVRIQPQGGTIEMLALFELEYPLIRDAGIKAVTFFDAGNSFDHWPRDNFKIRTDWGFGIRWFSPIGPLRFEIGFPFRRQGNEDESVFQFYIGPPF